MKAQIKRSKLKVTKYILPAYWASYLINGDDSGMEPSDKTDCAAFLARHALNHSLFANCGEQYFSKGNDATSLAGDVCEYSYLQYPKPKQLTDKERLDFILTHDLLKEGLSNTRISWPGLGNLVALHDREHFDKAMRQATAKSHPFWTQSK